MKGLAFIVCIFIFSGMVYSQSSYTTSVSVIFSDSPEEGSVKLAVETYTPTWSTKVYLQETITGNQIDIEGCYSGSVLDQIIIFKDTILVEGLTPATYHVNYTAHYYNQDNNPGSSCSSPVSSQSADTTFIIASNSLTDIKNQNSINIFPIPANETQYIAIQNKSDQYDDVTIEVIDVTGKKVKNIYKGKLIQGENTIPAYIGDLSNAVYTYKIKIGSRYDYIKFVKN